VRVQERVGVALDLQVDPPELRVASRADGRHRPPEQGHVLKEHPLLVQREVGQLIDARRVTDQHAVARQVLHVADHGEAGIESPENGGVGAGQGAADTVGSKVAHGRRP